MKWLWHSFKAAPLANKLREVFGADTTFGSPKVRTLLMMVMRNATTDSPWPPIAPVAPKWPGFEGSSIVPLEAATMMGVTAALPVTMNGAQ